MYSGFRLMTTNLLQDRCDVSRFTQVLDDVSPDLVVAQELAPGPAEALAQRYPYTLLHPSLDFTGRGIASRIRADFDDIAMPARNGTAASFEIGGEPVRLAGIHLMNPISFPWWRSGRARSRQVRAVAGWLDLRPGPVVVAGDFNASPAWPAYKAMEGRLTDLVAEEAAARGAKPEPTWGWRPGWPRMLRIDHVFGVGVRAREALVVPISGSDHAALVVDIELTPAVGP